MSYLFVPSPCMMFAGCKFPIAAATVTVCISKIASHVGSSVGFLLVCRVHALSPLRIFFVLFVPISVSLACASTLICVSSRR